VTIDIWAIPKEMRMAAFIDRWKDLEEHTGCRTLTERDEMAAIADAIMPALIDAWDLRHPQHPTKNVRSPAPCICASIIGRDETRHFRECPLRAKYPDPPAGFQSCSHVGCERPMPHEHTIEGPAEAKP
jgi:hypothetical protein